MKSTPNRAALIPAAGRSSRMGTYKAFLPDAYDIPFIEHITRTYAAFGCDPVVVITNAAQAERDWSFLDLVPVRTELIVNTEVERGRVHSIRLGLQAMGEAESCFIQNADNPFIEKEVLQKLIEASSDSGYVSPRFKGKGGHPVLISRPVMDHILSTVGNDLNLRKLLTEFNGVDVEVDQESILVNINTRKEYDQMIQMEGRV